MSYSKLTYKISFQSLLAAHETDWCFLRKKKELNVSKFVILHLCVIENIKNELIAYEKKA